MKKEIIVAILIGLSMGLIITFGVFRVKNSITDKPLTNLEETDEATTSATPTVMAIHSPEDGIVQTETEITVTGTTIPNSHIVLFANDTDYISNSDESGNFSFKIELEEGSNILRIHVVDTDGATTVDERLVIVSSAFEDAEAAAIQAEVEAEAKAASEQESTDDEEVTEEETDNS